MGNKQSGKNKNKKNFHKELSNRLQVANVRYISNKLIDVFEAMDLDQDGVIVRAEAVAYLRISLNLQDDSEQSKDRLMTSVTNMFNFVGDGDSFDSDEFVAFYTNWYRNRHLTLQDFDEEFQRTFGDILEIEELSVRAGHDMSQAFVRASALGKFFINQEEYNEQRKIAIEYLKNLYDKYSIKDDNKQLLDVNGFINMINDIMGEYATKDEVKNWAYSIYFVVYIDEQEENNDHSSIDVYNNLSNFKVTWNTLQHQLPLHDSFFFRYLTDDKNVVTVEQRANVCRRAFEAIHLKSADERKAFDLMPAMNSLIDSFFNDDDDIDENRFAEFIRTTCIHLFGDMDVAEIEELTKLLWETYRSSSHKPDTDSKPVENIPSQTKKNPDASKTSLSNGEAMSPVHMIEQIPGDPKNIPSIRLRKELSNIKSSKQNKQVTDNNNKEEAKDHEQNKENKIAKSEEAGEKLEKSKEYKPKEDDKNNKVAEKEEDKTNKVARKEDDKAKDDKVSKDDDKAKQEDASNNNDEQKIEVDNNKNKENKLKGEASNDNTNDKVEKKENLSLKSIGQKLSKRKSMADVTIEAQTALNAKKELLKLLTKTLVKAQHHQEKEEFENLKTSLVELSNEKSKNTNTTNMNKSVVSSKKLEEEEETRACAMCEEPCIIS